MWFCCGHHVQDG